MRSLTTPEIEVAIARLFNPRTCVIVPNISWGIHIHECDVFVLRKSGYAIEVEIKQSKADLKADLKKGHHHNSKLIRELYFAIPDEKYDEWKEYIPEGAGVILYRTNEYYTCHAYIRLQAKIRKDSRKLTDREQFNVARLGCMRIWTLKRNLNSKIRNG